MFRTVSLSIIKFIFGIKLYMFRTVPLSIIRSFSLYTQQWSMSYTFADSLQAGSGRSSILILLPSCWQTCVTYTIAVCTVKNSWWWTEELSETCRVLLQKLICEISTSSWFYYKNLSRCTVTWTSKSWRRVTTHTGSFSLCTTKWTILPSRQSRPSPQSS